MNKRIMQEQVSAKQKKMPKNTETSYKPERSDKPMKIVVSEIWEELSTAIDIDEQ